MPAPVPVTHPATASAGFIEPELRAKAIETYPPDAPGATTAIDSVEVAADSVQWIVSFEPTAKLQLYPSVDAGHERAAAGGGDAGGGGDAAKVAVETAVAAGVP